MSYPLNDIGKFGYSELKPVIYFAWRSFLSAIVHMASRFVLKIKSGDSGRNRTDLNGVADHCLVPISHRIYVLIIGRERET